MSGFSVETDAVKRGLWGRECQDSSINTVNRACAKANYYPTRRYGRSLLAPRFVLRGYMKDLCLQPSCTLVRSVFVLPSPFPLLVLICHNRNRNQRKMLRARLIPIFGLMMRLNFCWKSQWSTKRREPWGMLTGTRAKPIMATFWTSLLSNPSSDYKISGSDCPHCSEFLYIYKYSHSRLRIQKFADWHAGFAGCVWTEGELTKKKFRIKTYADK